LNASQALADLNDAAERIWEAASPACPALSIEVLPEIGSTNTELMARGRRGECSPTLLAAVAQTAGRGRQGRTWLAEPGASLTFSLGLPLRLDEVPGGGSALSLAVGLAVAQAIDTGLGQANLVGLKWPNDLWLHGRKLGGILIEASPAPGLDAGERWIVIGIGLNIHAGALPEQAAALSQSLAHAHTHAHGTQAAHHTPKAPSPGQVWRWIAPALLAQARAFAAQGFGPLQAAYAQRDVLAGQHVGLWTTPGQGPQDGHPPAETGQALGVSETGALLVHTGKGCQSWTTGEVSVRLQAR